MTNQPGPPDPNQMPHIEAGEGDIMITLAELVGQITGLRHVDILADSNLAEAVGSALTLEYGTGPERFTRAFTNGRQRELREQGLLPVELEDQERFAEEYRALMWHVRRGLILALPHLPDEAIGWLEDMTAPVLAEMITSPGGFEFQQGAGVQVELDHRRGVYTARTLGGLVCEFERHSGVVVEYGPGLSGGVSRVRELESDVWDAAILLERASFPVAVIDDVADRLGLDPSRIVMRGEGMQRDAGSIAERMHRGELPKADLVIAAKLRNASSAEVRSAIGWAPDLGSNLIVSDFERGTPRETDVQDMMRWAADRFGPPIQTHTGVVRFGQEDRVMHDAVFSRQE